MEFEVTSPAFSEGDAIPSRYTCDGANVSPALRWNDPPNGTESYVLLVEDPDAPGGTFIHWVLFNIPSQARELPEGVTNRGILGRNDSGDTGYGGPCPPRNHGAHRYVFTLYALDRSTLALDEGVAWTEVEAAMDGHVLAETQLIGYYQRMREG
ncbi:MAG: YbhB/YbcL family Raf kinase inhibitor-like protein [Chloroflexota bacterium]|nr:YbhB/YbcL family Raf kinase inhibitor-like protein [Chloroflexota bacterium]